MVERHSEIEAQALFNFELLLHHWGIDYIKISPVEYDFLSPSRKDIHFGACRFNTDKGTGADFAGTSYSTRDFNAVGQGFSHEDFASFGEGISNNWGFNIIGLCQRIFRSPTYADAAAMLTRSLKELKENPSYHRISKSAIEKRKQRLESEIQEKIKFASKIWEKCITIDGTPGETYLASRGILLDAPEANMRFHPLIMNGELKKPLPTLLFKVQKEPNGNLVAIHRIYLKEDGNGKANVNNPKMALGSIKGGAVWFGKEQSTLSIVEGCENALAIRCLGGSYVVSTINAGNFSFLRIPPYVTEVILLPDNDEAGRLATVRATRAYQDQGKTVKIKFPPLIKGKKKSDWNDFLLA